ncbi:hypothetical protein E4P39_16300 [Blastococcus sp. CT_GayMR19]|uniref:hypothetical protein n=1 Tax=Blastococcus sp. CT_GayMR19 TaxID=2559608 RepID=UPI0010736DE5|nr:hypothetical protein [Blastococcus sp. CT_GayMR19]TFV72512.1 hypothetical protein E4P39_16300 [Blastococcus sp. CT_GayMR19]
MFKILARFWAVLVSLAGVVGLYIAAEVEDLLWAFWVVVAGALAITAATILAPRGFEWTKKVRGYDRLLELSGRLQVEIESLKESNRRATLEAEKNWSVGMEEGIRQVRGALLAQSLEHVPELVGVQAVNGDVAVLARWPDEHPEILGARYDLEVRTTGAVRGVVEARTYDQQRELVAFVCVGKKSSAFWTRLAERADVDTELPKGLALRPSALPVQDNAATAEVESFDAVEGTI